MISNINSQPLDNSAIANSQNATTHTADASQSSLKTASENSPAATPSTIVRLGGATAPAQPLTYTAAGTSDNIDKQPASQTEELETTVVGTSGGIGKPPP